MREILFKAKRIDSGEWVIGHYIPFGLDVDIHYDIVFSKGDYIFCSESQQLIEINIKTLCQYTGLKDKNGNMIFENDVLNYWENGKENIKQRLKVFFENGQFVVDHYAINLLNSRNMSSEIIGNIFDNKELLGDKV